MGTEQISVSHPLFVCAFFARFALLGIAVVVVSSKDVQGNITLEGGQNFVSGCSWISAELILIVRDRLCLGLAVRVRVWPHFEFQIQIYSRTGSCWDPQIRFHYQTNIDLGFLKVQFSVCALLNFPFFSVGLGLAHCRFSLHSSTALPNSPYQVVTRPGCIKPTHTHTYQLSYCGCLHVISNI